MSRSRDAADQINRVNSSAADATAMTIDSSENISVTGNINLSTTNTFITGAGHNVLQVDATKTYFYGGTGGVQFRTADNASALVDITNGGNVGIGTTSPGAKLDFGVTSNNSHVINLRKNSNSITSIGVNAEYGVRIAGPSDAVAPVSLGAIDVSDGSTFIERMRIASDGTVFIGKSAFGNTTGIQLNQSGSGYLVRDSATVLLLNRLGTDGTVVQFYNDSNGYGSISMSGTSTSYNTSSDYRLKTDVQPMVGASARVQALNPVNFEWISNGTRVDGFLAHEAATVVPEAINGEKDAMRDEEYEVTPAVYEDVVIDAVEEVLDEDGNVLTEAQPERTEQNLVTEAVMGTRTVPDYQGIDQSKLVPLLTAALQEALTKIDSLETRLTALEG